MSPMSPKSVFARTLTPGVRARYLTAPILGMERWLPIIHARAIISRSALRPPRCRLYLVAMAVTRVKTIATQLVTAYTSPCVSIVLIMFDYFLGQHCIGDVDAGGDPFDHTSPVDPVKAFGEHVREGSKAVLQGVECRYGSHGSRRLRHSFVAWLFTLRCGWCGITRITPPDKEHGWAGVDMELRRMPRLWTCRMSTPA